MSLFTLLTPRLKLRKLIADDLDSLVELDSDPEVMRYINGGHPTQRSDYEERILERMLAWNSTEPYGYFAALEAGTFIGWFHLRPSVIEPEIPELGYRLRRSVWGRGLATEGGRALCELAFGLGAPKVDAVAMPENTASIAVMRKCGMRFVAELEHPSVPILVHRYVVAEDWKKYFEGKALGLQ